MTDLLPCPFCGSEDIEAHLDEEYWRYFALVCNGCDAAGPVVDTDSIKGEAAKITAVKKWNTRTLRP